MGKNFSRLGVQSYGIAFQLSQKRHPPSVASKDLLRGRGWDGACGVALAALVIGLAEGDFIYIH